MDKLEAHFKGQKKTIMQLNLSRKHQRITPLPVWHTGLCMMQLHMFYKNRIKLKNLANYNQHDVAMCFKLCVEVYVFYIVCRGAELILQFSYLAKASSTDIFSDNFL